MRDLAAAGSRNHQLLCELMARGCQLTGTESPALLLEEYHLARASLQREPRAGVVGADTASSLLERADRFIADQIDRTLEPGWTGLLFLGMLHAVDRFLPADVQLTRLKQEADHQARKE